MKKTRKFSCNYNIAAGIAVIMLLIFCGFFAGIHKGQPAPEELSTEEGKKN